MEHEHTTALQKFLILYHLLLPIPDKKRYIVLQTLYYLVIRNYKEIPVLLHGIDEHGKSIQQILPNFHDYRFIMTVIDVLSKYAWLIPLKFKHGKDIRLGLETLVQKILSSSVSCFINLSQHPCKKCYYQYFYFPQLWIKILHFLKF